MYLVFLTAESNIRHNYRTTICVAFLVYKFYLVCYTSLIYINLRIGQSTIFAFPKEKKNKINDISKSTILLYDRKKRKLLELTAQSDTLKIGH